MRYHASVDLHHLAFRTTRLPALHDFYERVLELPRVKVTESGSVWLRVGTAVLMLEARPAEEASVREDTLELVAFRVSVEQRTRLLARLRAHGVEPEAATEHTTYVRDPDGRRIGLSTYPL
jgi:catechol 2,3-dioxygenase-like lactoylglutathione lyase family enzyme